MNTSSGIKLFILALALLVAIPVFNTGCQEEPEQPQAGLPGELSAALVPNTPLDIYLYASQSRPTTIPAEVLGLSRDVSVDSFALWGIPSDGELVLGMAITGTSESEASAIYAAIKPEKRVWGKLDDERIYLVYGSGEAAEALKTAINTNDFRYYDDEEALAALATLPGDDKNELVAVAIAKPSEELLELITEISHTPGSDLVNIATSVINLKVITGGLYSPRQIHIAELVGILNGGGSIADLELGAVVSVKYGLPTIIVKLAADRFLTQYGFDEEQLGDLVVYKGIRNLDSGGKAHLVIRLEDNYIFAAASGQESYAESLITSINLE